MQIRFLSGVGSMEKEDLRKKVDLAFLSAFYGGLLTEKQRHVLSLHCEEDLSLGEIAEEVGLANLTSFYQRFRSYAGCTPQEYRKQG